MSATRLSSVTSDQAVGLVPPSQSISYWLDTTATLLLHLKLRLRRDDIGLHALASRFQLWSIARVCVRADVLVRVHQVARVVRRTVLFTSSLHDKRNCRLILISASILAALTATIFAVDGTSDGGISICIQLRARHFCLSALCMSACLCHVCSSKTLNVFGRGARQESHFTCSWARRPATRGPAGLTAGTTLKRLSGPRPASAIRLPPAVVTRACVSTSTWLLLVRTQPAHPPHSTPWHGLPHRCRRR